MYVEKYHLERGEGIQRDDKEKMATEGSHSQRSTSEKKGKGCSQQSHDRKGLNSTREEIDSQK
jgi:hypothetical protein